MYVKIFAQILDSTIARNPRLRRFFMDLLLLADREGQIVMPKDAIAHRLRVPQEEVDWGIAELMKPDPESKNAHLGGRRLVAIEGMGYGWQVVNYDLYRGLKDADELRQGTRDRVKNFRERKALRSKTTGPLPKVTGHPTKEQVSRFFVAKGFTSDAEMFFHHYEAKGWVDGQGRPIANWEALAATWERREPSMRFGQAKREKPATDYEADMTNLAKEAEALRAAKAQGS